MKNINGWHLLDNERDTPMVESALKYANDSNYRDWHSNFIDDIVELYDPNGGRGVALDIGGCVGMMAVPFAQEYAGVFTFEINPAVRECLRANTEQYDNITVFGFGLSNTDGSARFKEHPASGLGRVAHDGDKIYPVRTLDSFRFSDIDLIKLDVEGHEYEVLQGGINTISECKPLVITEIHSTRSRHSYHYRQNIYSLMGELDYILVDVRQNDYIWRHK